MGPNMNTNMASKQNLELLDSWEDLDETGVLEKNFNRMLAPNRPYDSNSNGISKTQMQIVLTGEDALRSQYVPTEPTVKILKRPSKDAQNNSDSKTFQPKKTLQQREQEYAEARLRILGESSNEKSDESNRITIQGKPRSTELENVIRLPKGPDGTNGFTTRR